jgi:CDP-diglyceride synthetase
MAIDISKLINLSYLLDPNPPYQLAYLWLLGGFFIFSLLVALFLPFYPWQPWQIIIKNRLSPPLWILGLVGLVLLFARNQSIPYFSSRIFLSAFILVLLLWIGYSLTVALFEVGKNKRIHEEEQRFARYLPRPKR